MVNDHGTANMRDGRRRASADARRSASHAGCGPGGRGGTSRTATALARGSVWPPPQDADWMWELGSPLNTSNAGLMGTGVTAYNGDTPPGDMNGILFNVNLNGGRKPCR